MLGSIEGCQNTPAIYKDGYAPSHLHKQPPVQWGRSQGRAALLRVAVLLSPNYSPLNSK